MEGEQGHLGGDVDQCMVECVAHEKDTPSNFRKV
jgi:hypothetical protein